MFRPDGPPVSIRGSSRNRASWALNAGLSLSLHGAALAGFYWLHDVTPPEPYRVVAVQLIEAADIAGISKGRTDQPSPESGVDEALISDDAPGDEIDVVPSPPKVTMTETPATASVVENEDVPSPPGETMAKMPVTDDRSLDIGDAPPAEVVRSKMAAAAPDAIEVSAVKAESTPKPELTSIRIPERRTVTTDPVNLPRVTEDFVKRSGALSNPKADPPVPRRKPKPPGLRADKAPKSIGVVDEIDRLKDASLGAVEKSASPHHGDTDADRFVDKTPTMPKPDTGTEQAPAASRAVASRLVDGTVGEQPHTPAHFDGVGISNPPPRYPYLARRRGQQGRVVLRVLVSAAGTAKAVAVRRSSGYRLLDGAAVKAVRLWRFVPARRRGSAVPGTVDVPISFTLTD